MGVPQRIRIGDILIESKTLDWDTIKKLARGLRRFAKWNPEQKEWHLTWRAISKLSDFLKFINSEVIEADTEYAYRILDAIENIVSKIPKVITDDETNRILIAAIDIDPYEIIPKVNRDVLPMTIITKKINIESIGPVEVAFISMNKDRATELVRSGMISEVPQELRDHILQVIPHEAPKARIGVSRGNRIIVEIPQKIEPLIEELKELATIRYYQQTETGLELKEIQRYRIYEKPNRVVIYLPAFTAGFVEEIIRKYGLEPDVDYKLPDKILDYLNKNFNLYPHQAEAITRWLENGGRGTIVIPTGGGKTIVGLAAIYELKRPTVIFVPNLWLIEQWKERISQFLGIPKTRVGVLGGGQKTVKDITVATYQSGVKNIEIIADKFWLAIYDESHHIPAKTFRQVAMNLRAPYKMALSATPKRSDKNEILLFKLAGKIIFEITYSRLVRMGLVAPMAFRRIKVPMPITHKLKYMSLEREASKAATELERKRIVNQMISVAQENPVKLEVIRKIIEKHKRDKIFIFAPSIKFAREIAKEVNKLVPAAALTAEESKKEEELIIRRFKSCTLQALVIIKKAEEGVDIGDANVAIIVGGSKQEREFIQRVGRVLRVKEGEKKLAWVYELVSEGTVEEVMARKRGAFKLIREVSDYVIKNFGVPAYREIQWEKEKKLD